MNNNYDNIIPVNAMRRNPFRKKTIQEITNGWREWKEKSPSLFTVDIVGIVASSLLDILADQAKSRILEFLQGLLFPNDNTLTMEEILRATEQFINQKLDDLTYNRVSAELVGLKDNIIAFNRQVDDFLQKRSITPIAIIDSINTMQQLFLNRLPQFKLSSYEVLLLPLFAQAATLHLTFLKDVITHADEWNVPSTQLATYKDYFKKYVAEHSNYCLKTYDSGFKTKFGTTATLNKMVEFKTFMTLNVLNFVSIWSMLKYEKLFISSSANLYNIGNNTENQGSFPISYWPFFNSYIQANSNYILSGVAGELWRMTLHNIVEGIYVQDSLSYIQTSYTGGKQGGIGFVTRSSDISLVQVDELVDRDPRDTPVGVKNYPFNCTLRDPIGSPYHSSFLNEYRPGLSGIERIDAFKNDEGVCGARPYSGNRWTYYPDYSITNISGTTIGSETNTSPLYFGENRPINSRLNAVVCVYNRKSNIAGISENGTIIHLSPNDGTGFTVSPLQPTTAQSPYVTIQENYGNHGDSLHIMNNIELLYTIKGNRQFPYRLYLRLSGSGSVIARTNSFQLGQIYLNTDNDNEGITDNNSRFKDLRFDYVFPLYEQTELFLEFIPHLNGSIDLMNIILLPADVTPLY